MADDKIPALTEQELETLSGTDSDWGEDWESAFQAEEDSIFANAENYDDLFPESTKEPAPSPASVAEDDAPRARPSPVKTAGARRQTASVVSILKNLVAGAGGFAKALYRPRRLVVFGPLTLIVVAALAFFLLPPPAPLPEKPLDAILSLPEPVDPGARMEPPPPVSTEADVAAKRLPLPPPAPPPGNNIRKKWPFPSFFIPVMSENKDQKVAFLVVDLALVTLLQEGEELPTDQEIFIRNSIYQFYTNQPLYELRRYSLARGEMKRKLRAWLHKQWPEGAIETITFLHYEFI